MEYKWAINKESLEGKRITACLKFGFPLNILEAFGPAMEKVAFDSHEAKTGYYLFQIAFLFTVKGKKVALFERAAKKDDSRKRLTSGKGILCLTPPDVSGARSFESQVMEKIPDLNMREVKILGQGVSRRQGITYLLTVLEVALEEERSMTLAQGKDLFVGFVPFSRCPRELGEGREVDHAILDFLRGRPFDKESFIPSAIDCWIEQNIITGLDIYRFSTRPSHEQVLKYVTLQVHVQKLLEDMGLSAYTLQTGDGCFLVFRNCGEEATLRFCLELQNRLKKARKGDDDSDLRLRYSLHRGPVYRVMDLNRQVNFIGEGINYCARLLSVKEPDVLYVSQSFRESLQAIGKAEIRKFKAVPLMIKHQEKPDQVFLRSL